MPDNAAAVSEPAARNIEKIAALERAARHDRSRVGSGLCQRLDVHVTERNGQVEQLLEDTNIETLATALDRELPDNTTAPSSTRGRRTTSPRRS